MPPLTEDMLAQIMDEAHLPSLIVAMAHLSGRFDLLKEAWKPKYVPYVDQRDGGLDAAAQREVAEVARALLPVLLDYSPERLSQLPPGGLERLMDFVAGLHIPERYLPLLEEELGLQPQAPVNSAPKPDWPVLVIGAGMSGLLAGVKLAEGGYPFEIIERGESVGGTWRANIYPGCRVDSQSHLYCYSFQPNHDWPHRFSTQTALKAYFEAIAEAHGLWPHIRLRTELVEARWDEAAGLWRARLREAGGRDREVEARAVISAVGQLNRPKIPLIAGRETFAGPQMHTAEWDPSVAIVGRAVAVVGTGASAFQVIPEIAAVARKVTVFQRSAPWVAPTPDYHTEVGEGQKLLLRRLPLYANWYRFWLFWTMTEGAMPALKADPEWSADDGSISALNQMARNALVGKMREQVGPRLDLLEKIVPTSPLGGKRTLRDNGRWIETLRQDHVDLVTQPIARMTPEGVETADGVLHEADVIVYGTGFHAARFLEPARIFGRGGIELTAQWNGDPRAYLGMTVPGFPNFFCIYGPNTNLVAQGSITFFSECSARYIVGALDLLRAQGASAMEPKTEAFERYNERVDAENARMAWGLPGVVNWYKSASGRVSQNWPFPLIDYWSATKAPDPADFVFVGVEDPPLT
jgi:4-hydroxyacetophenone monooxygenase